MDEKKQNRQTPVVELGGRLWELRFGHKAMRLFCRTTKCNMSNFDESLDSYDNQILLIWCILQAQDSSVTRNDLDDWLDELLLEEVFDIVQDAIAAAMPSSAGKRLAEARAAEAGAAENPMLTTSSETA